MNKQTTTINREKIMRQNHYLMKGKQVASEVITRFFDAEFCSNSVSVGINSVF